MDGIFVEGHCPRFTKNPQLGTFRIHESILQSGPEAITSQACGACKYLIAVHATSWLRRVTLHQDTNQTLEVIPLVPQRRLTNLVKCGQSRALCWIVPYPLESSHALTIATNLVRRRCLPSSPDFIRRFGLWDPLEILLDKCLVNFQT